MGGGGGGGGHSQSRPRPRMVNLHTKEGVESLHILPYTSTNVHVVNSQWLKFKAVNGQSPKNQRCQRSKAEESLVKVLTFIHNLDYRLHGSDTPLHQPMNSFFWKTLVTLTDKLFSLEVTFSLN